MWRNADAEIGINGTITSFSCLISKLTSLVVAVVHGAEDVLRPGHWLVAPTHRALGATRPVTVGAILAHPLLLTAILLTTILCCLHLSETTKIRT